MKMEQAAKLPCGNVDEDCIRLNLRLGSSCLGCLARMTTRALLASPSPGTGGGAGSRSMKQIADDIRDGTFRGVPPELPCSACGKPTRERAESNWSRVKGLPFCDIHCCGVFLDRFKATPAPAAEPGKPATELPSLINQLMMGADAWMQLANQTLPGLTPEQGKALHLERSQRAAEYRERAEMAREILARGGVDKYNLIGLQCAVLDLIGSPLAGRATPEKGGTP